MGTSASMRWLALALVALVSPLLYAVMQSIWLNGFTPKLVDSLPGRYMPAVLWCGLLPSVIVTASLVAFATAKCIPKHPVLAATAVACFTGTLALLFGLTDAWDSAALVFPRATRSLGLVLGSAAFSLPLCAAAFGRFLVQRSRPVV